MPNLSVTKFCAYAAIYAASAIFVSACGGSSGEDSQPTAGGSPQPSPTVAPTTPPDPGTTPTPSAAPSPNPNPTATPEPSDPPPINPSDDFHVSSYTPEEGATNRSLVTDIRISFNKPLVPATAVEGNVALRAGSTGVDFDFAYDGNTTFTVTPKARLTGNTVYTVELSDSLMSEDGESLRAASWNFTTAGNLGDTPQSIIDSCMSAVDIEMLDAVNNQRAEGYQCTSGYFGPTYPYKWNCKVAEAAAIHSQDMATNDFFSHTGSDGSSTGDRLTRVGYNFRGWAENIAANQPNVPAVMEAWLESTTGHCSAIMAQSNTEFGSSLVVIAPGVNRFSRYWTQNFARPRN